MQAYYDAARERRRNRDEQYRRGDAPAGWTDQDEEAHQERSRRQKAALEHAYNVAQLQGSVWNEEDISRYQTDWAAHFGQERDTGASSSGGKGSSGKGEDPNLDPVDRDYMRTGPVRDRYFGPGTRSRYDASRTDRAGHRRSNRGDPRGGRW